MRTFVMVWSLKRGSIAEPEPLDEHGQACVIAALRAEESFRDCRIEWFDKPKAPEELPTHWEPGVKVKKLVDLATFNGRRAGAA